MYNETLNGFLFTTFLFTFFFVCLFLTRTEWILYLSHTQTEFITL